MVRAFPIECPEPESEGDWDVGEHSDQRFAALRGPGLPGIEQ